MDNFDRLGIFFMITIILFIICSPFLGSYLTCRNKAAMQEMEWSYGPIQGCMVKQENGKWIDYDRLRYMDN